MSTFKVEKILNANTILISPKWKVGPESGNQVTIAGLNYSMESEPYIEFRLNSFLVDKKVELIDPELASKPHEEGRLICTVLLDGTDITYYFPEFTSRKKVAG